MAMEDARRALAGRLAFDPLTNDPSMHLFVPSGLDCYILREMEYEEDEVLHNGTGHLFETCLEVWAILL